MNNIWSLCFAFFLGAIVALTIYSLIWRYRVNLSTRLKRFYVVLVEWVSVKQCNYKISDYFLDRNIHNIAIYGMKELGRLLLSELDKSDVEVKYVIDRNADYFFSDADIYKPTDDLPQVDMVVVTVLDKNKPILDFLEDKMDCPIVTIAQVVSSFKTEQCEKY